jgi:hypothetical protein
MSFTTFIDNEEKEYEKEFLTYFLLFKLKKSAAWKVE